MTIVGGEVEDEHFESRVEATKLMCYWWCTMALHADCKKDHGNHDPRKQADIPPLEDYPK